MKQRKRKRFAQFVLLLLVGVAALGGCAVKAQELTPSISEEETQARKTEVEIMDFSNERENVIYLAGGCFWPISM